MSNYRNEQIVEFAELLGALSNVNRLQLFLRALSCCRPGVVCATDVEFRTCVGELSEGMGLAASTVSHHLKQLRQVGLIRVVRRGQKSECAVNTATLKKLAEFFGALCATETVAQPRT